MDAEGVQTKAVEIQEQTQECQVAIDEEMQPVKIGTCEHIIGNGNCPEGFVRQPLLPALESYPIAQTPIDLLSIYESLVPNVLVF
ncbi:unnamed protein product [Colias eurytheme]|nr:unnamed protein product [Colias eurytheme]